jgi:hypothetical protein
MIRSSIIIANILIAFLVKLVSGAPSAEVKAPASAKAGEAFLVEVTITTNGVTDFMRYSMEFPAGWKAEKVETAGASFMFEKNSTNDKYSAKFLWSRVGDAPTLKISYRVTSPADFSGDIEFPCKLSHTVDNLPSNVQLTPMKIHIDGNASPTNEPVVHQPDSTAKPLASISVVRTVPQGEQSGQFLVDIVINKEDLTNFGKLEDSLPEGFTAKKVMTDGSDFSFEKNKVKFSWWVMPKKQTLHVQYMVIASPDLGGTQTITGIFSYVENEAGKIYPVSPSTVTMKANPAAIVQNENTQVNTAKENNTQNSGSAAKENNSGNTQEGNTGTTQTAAASKESNTGNTQEGNTNTTQTAAASKESNSGNSQSTGTSQQTETTTQPVAKAGTVAGVTFSVQIAAMIRRVPVEYYTSTFGIPGIVNTEQIDGLNKYTNGSFSSYQEARGHREALRAKGVAGPFVVAYNSGKRITVQEALMITSQKWVP